MKAERVIPSVFEFDSHIVMPGTCPAIHAVQPLCFKTGESAPFSARPARLDGVDCMTAPSWTGQSIGRLVLQAAEEIGTRKGRQEGEAALLLRLLERRFGVLPEWVWERVGAAETSALEEWGVRVLDAGTLDEIFAQ